MSLFASEYEITLVIFSFVSFAFSVVELNCHGFSPVCPDSGVPAGTVFELKVSCAPPPAVITACCNLSAISGGRPVHPAVFVPDHRHS